MRWWLQLVIFVIAVAIIVACLWGQPLGQLIASAVAIGIGMVVGMRIRTRRLAARDRRRAEREDGMDLRRSRV